MSERKSFLHSTEIGKWLALEPNVVVMGLTSMVATFGNTLWFFFLPIYYAERFGASAFQIAIIYAVWLAVAALGSSPAGALADTYGRKPIIVVSSLISALAVFVLAFSDNFLIAAVALPVSGLGSSFFRVSNTLIAESVETQRRGTAFGTFQTLSGIAAAFSPVLGGITISSRGYLPLFIIGGSLTLVAALARWLYVRETLPATERPSISGNKMTAYYRGMKGLVSDRLLLSLVLVYSMYNLVVDQNSYIPPLYARQVLGLDPITLGILFSVLLAVTATSRLPFGKLADRIGRKRTIVASWIGEILAVYIFVFAPREAAAIAVIGIATWMLFGVMDGPAINAWIAEVSDAKNRGLSMGVFYSTTFLATVPASLVSGYLFMISPQLPFYVNSVLGIIALVLLVGLAKPEKSAISPASAT